MVTMLLYKLVVEIVCMSALLSTIVPRAELIMLLVAPLLVLEELAVDGVVSLFFLLVPQAQTCMKLSRYDAKIEEKPSCNVHLRIIPVTNGLVSPETQKLGRTTWPAKLWRRSRPRLATNCVIELDMMSIVTLRSRCVAEFLTFAAEFIPSLHRIVLPAIRKNTTVRMVRDEVHHGHGQD